MKVFLEYWPVIIVILNVLGGWFIWSVRRELVTKKEFEAHAEKNAKERRREMEEIKERIGRHEIEQVRIMEKIEALPTQVQMLSLSNDISEVKAGVESLQHNMGLLFEHHLDLAKPKGN